MRYPWINVGKSKREKGWNLHLLSINAEAVQLLYKTLPCLSESKLSFKIVEDSKVLFMLNDGMLEASQVGKFMTVYSNSDKQVRTCLYQILLLGLRIQVLT